MSEHVCGCVDFDEMQGDICPGCAETEAVLVAAERLIATDGQGDAVNTNCTQCLLVRRNEHDGLCDECRTSREILGVIRDTTKTLLVLVGCMDTLEVVMGKLSAQRQARLNHDAQEQKKLKEQQRSLDAAKGDCDG